MRKFKVGDRVIWCEVKGMVVNVSYGDERSVMVYFGPKHGIRYFTDDGKSKSYYKLPSLTLDEEKK